MKKFDKFFKTVSYEKALAMGPRRFVKEYLFPAMRREHGNGFAMSIWYVSTKGVSEIMLDGLYHAAVACRSAMCVGGTMHAITNTGIEEKLAALLGLPYMTEGFDDAYILFFQWTSDKGPWAGLSNPFREAHTPQAKERIAEKAVMAAIRIGERLKKRAAKPVAKRVPEVV